MVRRLLGGSRLPDPAALNGRPGRACHPHFQTTTALPFSTSSSSSISETVIVSVEQGSSHNKQGAKPDDATTTASSGSNSDGDTSNPKVDDDDDEEMEQEDMFVEPHVEFAFRTKEWGGPRRGGRLPEPTRFGDWERKGRCSDF